MLMTKAKYSALLKTKYWKKKRAIILKLDKNTCVNCGAKKYLQVHHRYYLPGRLPWEYTNSALVTLCKTCHTKQHKNKPNSTFTKANKKKLSSFKFYKRKKS